MQRKTWMPATSAGMTVKRMTIRLLAYPYSRPAAWLPAVAFVFLTLSAPAPAQSVDDLAASCAGCHGENGVPQQPNMPVIWGQQQGYLYLQLRDFKSSARQNDVMSS